MCIGFFGLDLAPDLAFLLCFNRDEFIIRPTQHTHFWPDQDHICAGRDVQAGGTWLGVSKRGRVAFLTNLRKSDPDPAQAAVMGHRRSRGELPVGFLNSDLTPQEYCNSLCGSDYHGFNLVCVDLIHHSMAYTHNAEGYSSCGQVEGVTPAWDCVPAQKLEAGKIYGLSNGLLGEWSKVESGVSILSEVMASHTARVGAEPTGGDGGSQQLPWSLLFTALLGDSCRDEERRPLGPQGDPLPLHQINADTHLEYIASGRMVAPVPSKFGLYGTRSQLIMAIWRDGTAEVQERYLVPSKTPGDVPTPSVSVARADHQQPPTLETDQGNKAGDEDIEGVDHVNGRADQSSSDEGVEDDQGMAPVACMVGSGEGLELVGTWRTVRHRFTVQVKDSSHILKSGAK